MRTLILLLILSSFLYSQTVYEIPFSSKGNEIELTIKNTSSITAKEVKVHAVNLPEWIKFANKEETVKELQGNSEDVVKFKFAVEKESPVGEEKVIKFKITTENGGSWEKEIKIRILPPEKFELNQNYPNPFNPTTTISYTISAVKGEETAEVELRIYDILGREVAVLVKGEQKAGYYKVKWNAGGYASGMYIYTLTGKYGNGERKYERKKLILMK